MKPKRTPAEPPKPTLAGTRIGARMVPLDDLVPHPLNANVMPEEMREKLRAHIKRTGRYPIIVVRPHPKEPGRYEILDGRHRVLILRELGHTEARCDVWEVSDREAKLVLACSLIGASPVGCYHPAGVDGGSDRAHEGALALGNAGPNPFRDRTTISDEVPSGMDAKAVTIGVYDASGRLVRRLVNTAGSPGVHQVIWDGLGTSGERVPAGIYFYQLDGGGQDAQKRVIRVH